MPFKYRMIIHFVCINKCSHVHINFVHLWKNAFVITIWNRHRCDFKTHKKLFDLFGLQYHWIISLVVCYVTRRKANNPRANAIHCVMVMAMAMVIMIAKGKYMCLCVFMHWIAGSRLQYRILSFSFLAYDFFVKFSSQQLSPAIYLIVFVFQEWSQRNAVWII